MGLPVRTLICASNENRVLTDFLETGTYDRRRPFYRTSSPSMDILISSNLERLLYALAEEDDHKLAGWMKELSETGSYTVDPAVAARVADLFYGGSCDDAGTFETIRRTWADGVLCDTHTAVGVAVYQQYVKDTGDEKTPTVIASTASPFKFTKSVLSALGQPVPEDEFDAVAALESCTGQAAPAPLKVLRDKPVRFTRVIPKDQAPAFVAGLLEP